MLSNLDAQLFNADCHYNMILSCDVLCQFHLNRQEHHSQSYHFRPYATISFLPPPPPPPPPPQDHADIGLHMLLNDMDEDPFLNDETSLPCSASDTKMSSSCSIKSFSTSSILPSSYDKFHD